MGRPQNSIINTFFLRLEKLDNNSNRYKQQCRCCHKVFEKGRQETLVYHLIRKCDRISPLEKQRVMLEETWEFNNLDHEILNQSSAETSEFHEHDAEEIIAIIAEQSASSQNLRPSLNQGTAEAECLEGLEELFDGRTSNVPASSQIHPSPTSDLNPELISDEAPQETAKHKRSQFNEQGLKKYIGVRDRGACLRCRVGRKPCEKEDPCALCSKIKKSRLWTHKCIRTRTMPNFSLFSTNATSALANEKMKRLQAESENQPLGETVLVSLFDPSNATRLPALRFKERKSPGQLSLPARDSVTVTLDSDDERAVEQALMTLLKTHLRVAHNFERNDKIRALIEAGHKALGRGPDEILESILELHMSVTIMTDPLAAFDFAVNAGRLSVGSPTSITPEYLPDSHEAIKSQLLAFMERRLVTLSGVELDEVTGEPKKPKGDSRNSKGASTNLKRIMGALEWRLMRRPLLLGKETHVFIGALLLVNAAERISHYLARLENTGYNFSKPKQSYEDLARQGKELCIMLKYILEMRSIIPDIDFNAPDGFLLPSDSSTTDEIVQEWFVNASMTSADLVKWKNTQIDLEDPRSLDMTLIQRLLSPMDPDDPDIQPPAPAAPTTTYDEDIMELEQQNVQIGGPTPAPTPREYNGVELENEDAQTSGPIPRPTTYDEDLMELERPNIHPGGPAAPLTPVEEDGVELENPEDQTCFPAPPPFYDPENMDVENPYNQTGIPTPAPTPQDYYDYGEPENPNAQTGGPTPAQTPEDYGLGNPYSHVDNPAVAPAQYDYNYGAPENLNTHTGGLTAVPIAYGRDPMPVEQGNPRNPWGNLDHTLPTFDNNTDPDWMYDPPSSLF
jgi:hypothetical protein